MTVCQYRLRYTTELGLQVCSLTFLKKPNFGLTFGFLHDIIIKHMGNLPVYAPVAQLDRVFDYESKGRGFESRRAYHEAGSECSRIQTQLLF